MPISAPGSITRVAHINAASAKLAKKKALLIRQLRRRRLEQNYGRTGPKNLPMNTLLPPRLRKKLSPRAPCSGNESGQTADCRPKKRPSQKEAPSPRMAPEIAPSSNGQKLSVPLGTSAPQAARMAVPGTNRLMTANDLPKQSKKDQRPRKSGVLAHESSDVFYARHGGRH